MQARSLPCAAGWPVSHPYVCLCQLCVYTTHVKLCDSEATSVVSGDHNPIPLPPPLWLQCLSLQALSDVMATSLLFFF